MKPKNPMSGANASPIGRSHQDLKLDGALPLSEKALEALNQLEPSRRDFLKTAGVMMIGLGVGAATVPTADAQSPINPSGNVDATQLDNWVAIGADGSITVFAGKAELGTGMRTVQVQLAAEELSVPLERVTLVLCRSGITPDQGLTVGSFSTMTQFGTTGLRVAVDTARDALYQLASLWLGVDASQLVLKDGVFSISGDPASTVSYGELVEGRRFNLPVNRNAVPNDSSTWTVLGKSVPRADIPAKAKGTYQYVQKVRVRGMLHGRVVRPPALGAHVQNIDRSVVNGLAGNPQVVQVNDFVGVVANTEWHAIKAAEALRSGITWSSGDTLPAQKDLYTYMQQQPSRDSLSVNTGDVDQVMASAARTMTAQYLYPYQMHGSLASSCAVVDVRGGTGDKATVRAWSATQGVYNMRTLLSTLLKVPAANVDVVFVEGSGCYGHNGADPVTIDAALLSQAVGRPVRAQYSRSDEMTAGESYGYPMVSNEKVGLDGGGTIIAWDYENIELQRGEGAIGPTLGNAQPGYLAGFPTTPVVPTTTPPTNPTAYRNGNNTVPPYVSGRVNGVDFGTGTIASQRVLNRVVAGPLWTAWLRSPHRLQNTFAHESFMDEIAASLKVDPIQYRLRHIADPRLINVVNTVAQKANWVTRPSPIVRVNPFNPRGTGVATGRGFSLVLHSGNNGYTAMVAEVLVDVDTGVIKVMKVTSSMDTGPVINPDGLTNQIEGQVIQGISRTLYEEVQFDRASSSITSKDWRSYTVLKFGDVIPEIVTVLVNNLNAPVTGSGETTITIVAGAIGNAVFDATGVRMRQVPFTPENFLAAKAAQKS
jgi:nicotinate dehydrogenase subunit B